MLNPLRPLNFSGLVQASLDLFGRLTVVDELASLLQLLMLVGSSF